MGVSVMAPQGELPVPTPSGGANLELLTRISLLEQRLAEVEKHATADTYGIVRLSDSESVTESNGLALPASEKNASVAGSLANKILHAENAANRIKIRRESLYLAFEGGKKIYRVNLKKDNGISVIYGVVANSIGTETCAVSITNNDTSDFAMLFELIGEKSDVVRRINITYIGT